jgi:thiol-disulfide isomerase/thioredoxin
MNQMGLAAFFCVVLVASSLLGGPHRGLTMADPEGGVVQIDSLLTAGPVVLNFWATWCGPCRREMPQIEKISKELESRGVHFAAVSLDGTRNKKAVETYVEKYKVGLPVYYDTDWKLARRFKVMGIPTTILLDRDAEIQYATRGYRRGDEIVLKKKIEALLKHGEESETSAAAP